ncbi:MAG TPA: ComEA family DNA-binding protein [bacterium]|nr:ComEA family DNA-binding protein [bacterium]
MRWSRQEQLVVALAIAAAVVAGGLLLVLRRPSPPVRFVEPPLPTELVVQVDGEVARPGLYRVTRGSRVEDAIQGAGGATAQADLSAVNRARMLRDGDRVTVPALLPASPAGGSPGRVLDINTATAADLEALPGIGPVLAGRIVAYRSRHGPFQRLEELLQVEGIGPRLLQQLRSAVIVP